MATNFEWDSERECMVPVSEHKIEQGEVIVNEGLTEGAEVIVDEQAILAAKAQIKAAKDALKVAQGKAPGKRGKPKKYEYERKQVTAMVRKEDYEIVMANFTSVTEALNFLFQEYAESKQDIADIG